MKSIGGIRHGLIRRWELWGVPFIILTGSLLHFSFGLSGDWGPLGVVSAVNESVWEHLKLVFWPAVFWAVIEYFFIRRPGRDAHPNFLLSKIIGIYVMPAIIVFNFYTYTIFTGDSILAIDILSFVIAIFVGQIVSYRSWRLLRLPGIFNWVALAMLIIAAVLFAIFTFYPPKVSIFQDPVTGGYGIG